MPCPDQSDFWGRPLVSSDPSLPTPYLSMGDGMCPRPLKLPRPHLLRILHENLLHFLIVITYQQKKGKEGRRGASGSSVRVGSGPTGSMVPARSARMPGAGRCTAESESDSGFFGFLSAPVAVAEEQMRCRARPRKPRECHPTKGG